MVKGNEYIFKNIDEALKYVLELEQKSLVADVNRKSPPRTYHNTFDFFFQPSEENMKKAEIPIDSLDYPYSAWFNNAEEDKFVMTRLMSGRYSLKPNLKSRKYLFRGESEFHPSCKPNEFRILKQKRFTKEMMKGQEAELLMMSHPLVQLLDTGVELDGTLYRFEMNLFGLTQHYYNKTSFLDLTSDPMVAAFFATTKYDSKDDAYLPIKEKDSKIGILYYYNLDIGQDFGIRQDGSKSPLSTIGLQVFPRSGRQKGFLYDMQIGENFNEVAQVQAVRFYHDDNVSERIWKMFHEGQDLFPDDILSKHWKKYNHKSDVISKHTIMMNQKHNQKMSMAEVEAEAKSLGLEIENYVPKFTVEELDEYFTEVKDGISWQAFCQQIHIPGDRDGKMMQDLMTLPEKPKYKWAFERDDSHMIDYDKGYVLRFYKECFG